MNCFKNYVKIIAQKYLAANNAIMRARGVQGVHATRARFSAASCTDIYRTKYLAANNATARALGAPAISWRARNACAFSVVYAACCTRIYCMKIKILL